jgi:hypothetical protein
MIVDDQPPFRAAARAVIARVPGSTSSPRWHPAKRRSHASSTMDAELVLDGHQHG